jgi:hypothetical protein
MRGVGRRALRRQRQPSAYKVHGAAYAAVLERPAGVEAPWLYADGRRRTGANDISTETTAGPESGPQSRRLSYVGASLQLPTASETAPISPS